MTDDETNCEYCPKKADYLIKSHGESGTEIAACAKHRSKALNESESVSLDILVRDEEGGWVKDEPKTKQIRYERALSNPATGTPSEAHDWLDRNGPI